MWEVFCPVSGKIYRTVRQRWLAAALAWLWKGDYAREGEGWL